MKKRVNAKGLDYRLFFKRNAFSLAMVLCLAAGAVFFGKTAYFERVALGETLPFFYAASYSKSESEYKLNIKDDAKAAFSDEDDTKVLPDNERIAPAEVLVDAESLKNIEYVRKSFYTVDGRTSLTDEYIDTSMFLERDLSIDISGAGPKVLIFHTHSSEGFSDSDMSKGIGEGIWGTGEELKNILENKYGVSCIHDSGRYDVVEGKTKILGAYERMEPEIKKILEENPSVELVIDMHRDGVKEDMHFVTTVNGKQTANIMFFNGICLLNKNGTLEKTPGLENAYIKDNMALSFRLQLAANSLYPKIARKIYINAYRYSLHMLPKSILVEVGAQTNTKEEAKNAMEPLADIIAAVILKK